MFKKFLIKKLYKHLKSEFINEYADVEIEKINKEFSDKYLFDNYLHSELESVKLKSYGELSKDMYELSLTDGYVFLKKFLERKKSLLGQQIIKADISDNEKFANEARERVGKLKEINYILAFIESNAMVHKRSINNKENK